MKRAPTIVLVLSLVVNGLFVALFALALNAKTAALSFMNLDAPEEPFVTSAVVVSFPARSGPVVFGPVDISLKQGEHAALQFSAVVDKRQSNFIVTALYDHSVIQITETGFGVLLTAVNTGETVLQILSENGFRDIAVITVE
jgi:hypothetical protein